MSSINVVVVVPASHILLEEHRSQHNFVGLVLLLGVKVVDIKFAATSLVSSKGSERNVDIIILSFELNFEGVSP